MTEDTTDSAPQPDIERECETWDWARTAGVSAEDLRQALRALFAGAEQLRKSA